MTFKASLENIWRAFIDHKETIGVVVAILFILYFLFKYLKRAYHIRINDKFIAGLKWMMYEIKFPRENLKTPKAMEQVFAAVHGYYSYGFTPWQKWIQGKVELWTSFEIFATKNGTRFYVRFEEGLKNLIEAAFFSQYPDIELIPVEDYFHHFPHQLPNEKYEIFASDLELKAPQYLPIKTYQFFETPAEEQRLDPIATMIDGFANLKGEETILIQIVTRPAGKEFNPYKHVREEAEHAMDKLAGRQAQHKGPGVSDHMMTFAKNLIFSPFQVPNWGGHEEPKFSNYRFPTPPESDILKAIGERMSKTPFECCVRFVTVDRRENKGSVQRLMQTVFGAITQFNTRNLNQFGPHGKTITFKHKVAYNRYLDLFFRAARLERRKKKMWHAYHERDMPTLDHWYHKLGHLSLTSCIFGPDELATIFHPPGTPITARQSIEHVPAKKSGPPAGLPIIE